MLETLENSESTHGRENLLANKSTSREVGIAYVAGLVDGEGSIQAGVEDRTNKNLGPMLRICVQIHNTDFRLLNKAAAVMQENNIPFCWTLDHRPEYARACGSLHIAGKHRVKKFLELVIPYLTAKKQQAELLLELITYRESLVLSSKRNTRGELLEDPIIQKLIAAIKACKTSYPSLIAFSRRPNSLLKLTNPSTTTRFSGNKMLLDDIV